jgi:hypothetical protein
MTGVTAQLGMIIHLYQNQAQAVQVHIVSVMITIHVVLVAPNAQEAVQEVCARR